MRSVCTALLIVVACAAAPLRAAGTSPLPFMAHEYVDLTVTYAIHAKSIWHDTDTGGYWGGGIAEKDGNGAVRGMCNTMLGYSLLVHVMDQGWLEPAQTNRLAQVGLNRDSLLRYIRGNLRHATTHHVSNTSAPQPRWGQSWQSSLWVGAVAAAVLLAERDIPSDLTSATVAMMAAEADRLAKEGPGDYKPGDTKAEENGWNTHALAGAIAMAPKHPNVPVWWKALKSFTVNTHSVKPDQDSGVTLGEDVLGDIVKTANLFDDYSLENHGFFHPDYVQVSGQEVGEAWVLLALGDARHGTAWAARYEPYALYNLKPVWERVMRPLLLPSGEFVFPNGNDWTFHCAMNQAYLAWMATGVGDPVAAAAERRAVQRAFDRRQASPAGQILGDSNLQWWWEPLLIKRNTMALLMHTLRPGGIIPQSADEYLDSGEWTMSLPAAQVWLHRNAHYAVTMAWGKRKIATFTPAGQFQAEKPYWTLPMDDSILPAGVTDLVSSATLPGGVRTAVLGLQKGGHCALVCLPCSVVWLSAQPFCPIGIENDMLTSAGRTIAWDGKRQSYMPLKPAPAVTTAGKWLRVDEGLTFVCDAPGFKYEPAGKLNRRSAAIDRLTPSREARVWQMVPGAEAGDPGAAAADMTVATEEGAQAVTVRDGTNGERYRIELKTVDGIPAVAVARVGR